MEDRKKATPPKQTDEIKEVTPLKVTDEQKEIKTEILSTEPGDKIAVEKQEEILKQKQKETKIKKEVMPQKEQEKIKSEEEIKELTPSKQKEILEDKEEVTQSLVAEQKEIKTEILSSKPEDKTSFEKQEIAKQKETKVKKDLTPPKEQVKIKVKEIKEQTPPKQKEEIMEVMKEVQQSEITAEQKEIVSRKQGEKTDIEKQDKTIKQKQKETILKREVTPPKEDKMKIKEIKELTTLEQKEEMMEDRKKATPPKQTDEIKEVTPLKMTDEPKKIEKEILETQPEEKTAVERHEEILKQKETKIKKEVMPQKEQEKIKIKEEIKEEIMEVMKEATQSEITTEQKEIVSRKQEQKTGIEKQDKIIKQKQKKTISKKEVTPPKDDKIKSKEIKEMTTPKLKEDRKEVTPPKQKYEMKEVTSLKITDEPKEIKKEIFATQPEEKIAAEKQEEILKQKQKETKIKKEITPPKEQEKIKIKEEKKELTPPKEKEILETEKEAIQMKVAAKQEEIGTEIVSTKPEDITLIEKRERIIKPREKKAKVKNDLTPPKEQEKMKSKDEIKKLTSLQQKEIKEVTPPKMAAEQKELETKTVSRTPEEKTVVVKQEDIAKQRQKEANEKNEMTSPKEQDKVEVREVTPPKQKEVKEVSPPKITEQKEMKKEIVSTKPEEKMPVEKQEEIAKQKQKGKKVKDTTPQKEQEKAKEIKQVQQKDETKEVKLSEVQKEMEMQEAVKLKKEVTPSKQEAEEIPQNIKETKSAPQVSMEVAQIKQEEEKSFERKKSVSPPKQREERVRTKKETTPPQQKEEKKEYMQNKVTEDTNLKAADIPLGLQNGTEVTSVKKPTPDDKGKKSKTTHRVKKRERKASLKTNEDRAEEKEVVSKISESEILTLESEMHETESEKSNLSNGFVLEKERESFEIKQRKTKVKKEMLSSSQEEMLVDAPSHDDSKSETMKKDKISYSHSRSRKTARLQQEQETVSIIASQDESDYKEVSSKTTEKRERIHMPDSEQTMQSLIHGEETMETRPRKEMLPSGLPPRPKPRGRAVEKLPSTFYETPVPVRHRVCPESTSPAHIARDASLELKKVISVSEWLLERRRSRELQRKRFHSLSIERPISVQTTPQSRSVDRTYLRKEHYDTYHIPLSWRDINRQESQYKSSSVQRYIERERMPVTYTSRVKDYNRYDERMLSSYHKLPIAKFSYKEHIYRPSSVDIPSSISRSISPPQAPPRVRRSADHISTAVPRDYTYTQPREFYRSTSKENIIFHSKYGPSVPPTMERISSSSGREHSVITIKREEIAVRAYEPFPRWTSLRDVAGTTDVCHYRKSRQRTDEPCFVRSTSVRDIMAEDERYLSAFKRLKQMINEPPQPPPRTIRELRRDKNICYSSLTNLHVDAVPTPPPRLRHTDYKYIPRTISLRDLGQKSRNVSGIPIVMNETIRTSQELLRRSSDAKREYRIASIRERSREPEGKAVTRQSSYQPVSYSLMDINKQSALYLPADQQDVSYIRRDGACSSPVLGTRESTHVRQRSLTRGRHSREPSRPSSPELKTEMYVSGRFISPTNTSVVRRSVSPMTILRDITETSRPSSPETRNRYRSPTKAGVAKRSMSPMARLKHICDSEEQVDQYSRPTSPTCSMQERTRKYRYTAQMLAPPASQLIIPGHLSQWSTPRRRHHVLQETRRPSVTREDEEPMDQATIAAKLAEMNFTEEEAFQAAQHCDTIYQAIKFLHQHCDMCDNDYPANQIGAMVYCSHKACQECLKAFFTTEILDRTVDDLLCPFCEQPDLTDESISHDYFNHLEIMLKNMVDPHIHELFQEKLRDKVLMKNPDFHWCSQCLSGILSSPEIVKLICPDCKAVTCAHCHWLWDTEHEGKSCLEFQSIKEAQSEDVAEGPERQIEGHGIVCPGCRQRHRLAKGGCLQFHCNMCRNFFCSGCRKLYRKGKMCGATVRCYTLGWHAHHPRNCLFFLRDKEPEQLQEHLRKNKLAYETQPPLGYTAKEQCPVHVQKYSPKGWLPDVCGKPVQEKSFGLCKIHYVEYLVGLINKCILDPVAMMDIDDLKLMLRKSRIPFPERRRDELDSSYRIKLLKIIWQELPLEKLEGS